MAAPVAPATPAAADIPDVIVAVALEALAPDAFAAPVD